LWDAQLRAEALFARVIDRGLMKPGTRETELSDAIFELAREEFGVRRHWHRRVVRSGPNTLLTYFDEGPDRRLTDDDILFLDFGPVFEGWEADLGKSYVIGNDPRKKRLVEAIGAAFCSGQELFESRADLTAANCSTMLPAWHRKAVGNTGDLQRDIWWMPSRIKTLSAAASTLNTATISRSGSVCPTVSHGIGFWRFTSSIAREDMARSARNCCPFTALVTQAGTRADRSVATRRKGGTMAEMATAEQVSARVSSFLDLYSQPTACAAQLLCDRHDSSRVAYRLVAPDFSATEITYGTLRSASERLAAAFARLGLRPGDRIATLMGKSQAYLITVVAIWRLGAVHVPLFTAFATPAIAFRLKASGTKFVVCDVAQRSKLLMSGDVPPDPACRVITTGPADSSALALDELLAAENLGGFSAASVGGDEPILEVFTSGTTGPPKAVQVPLRALAAIHTYAEFGLGLQPDDVFWNAADPGWAYGLYFGILATLITGVRSLLFEGGHSPEATYEILSRYQVTNLTAAPTVYRSLRAAAMPPPPEIRLRCASSAGEPLTREVNEWARNALGTEVYDHYGQTEAGMLINNHHHPALRRALKPGSMGQPMPGWAAVVLRSDRDELAGPGELGRVAIELSRSSLAWFKGYANDASKSGEKFTSDGHWYLTGDTGFVDSDGYFFFNSRDDDVIIMAGYRIGPVDVESVIASHPSIAECAVIATPDAVRGEVLEAVVVLRESWISSEELTQELQQWVKNRYAAHAYPRRIHYLDILPKTPSGKVQRFVLRARFRDQ
jgi:acetyl-CoA synthetase